MTRPYPSLTGRRLAAQREKVDPLALDMVRALEDAYYGTATAWTADGVATARSEDGWRHGRLHPVMIGGKTYDKLATVAESRAQFDRLHGLIWAAHEAALTLQKQADGIALDDGEAERLTECQAMVRMADDDVSAAVPAHLRVAFDA